MSDLTPMRDPEAARDLELPMGAAEPMSDPLERRIHRALREAPLRRAPASLESGVLREIARRNALPWWRRSYARWPRLARVGFAVSAASIAAAMLAVRPWMAGVTLTHVGAWQAGAWQAGGVLLPWTKSALTLVDAARDLHVAVVRSVPPEWLYGAATAGAILYAALFGLGAVAYRVLYLTSNSPGDRP